MPSQPGVFIVKDEQPYMAVATVALSLQEYAARMMEDPNPPVGVNELVFFAAAVHAYAQYIVTEANLAMLDPDTEIL